MVNLSIQQEGTLLNVAPEGRLDTGTSPEFRAELFPHLEGIQDVILDFKQIEYISSAGLRVLLELYQELEDRGGSLRLINVSSGIMAIMKLVNFNEIVDVETI